MSKGFRANRSALSQAAGRAHEHAATVERHSRDLDTATRGKVLGRGKLGQIVDKAVRPVLDSMISDMSKAMAGGHRSIGHGLEITKKNLDEAEGAVHRSLQNNATSLAKEGVKNLEPGQSVPGRKALRQLYHRRIDERVEELRSQGHGVGRHLDVTDQQLKDRLGTPVMEGPQHNRTVAKDPNTGYVRSTDKVDPLHGPPGTPGRPTPPDLYYDAEKGPPNRHRCESYSTAFKDNESYVYADEYARSRLDPSWPGRQVVEFAPSDAWGPGGHTGKFRGYYIDPDQPFDHNGAVNYKEVNFKNATVKAVYEPDGNGGFKLHTMFPEPVFKHNRSRHQGI
ncbi:hypothetical protein CFP65_3670 [Kitasatospora sp. MMS16-BH015]|uniref:hypothetical protein n=1 Tax=Kitasatospora sp. MMS16-BH015 TaxID=2018025 RepID=UPI000CA19B9B|nr:hypothetical protein [Kitasatospora sp. MMS16-BH015]AUG78458.1 hypothetical protein CFP65_3670 [Kitasatospora sp. MMS16-BH015]